MTVFLGTLWSSIKEVKYPFVFEGEQGIALHSMQRNWASSRFEGDVSWLFSSCGRILSIFLGYSRDGLSKLVFVQ